MPCRIGGTGASGRLPANRALALATGVGRAGSVPGDRARSDPFLCFTQMQEGDRASLQEGFGVWGGSGVFCWIVLFPSSTGDVPLPLLASMTLGASPPRCPALPRHTDHHKPRFFPPRPCGQKHPSAAKAQSSGRPKGAPGLRQPLAAHGQGAALARNNAAGRRRLLPVAALPYSVHRSDIAAAAPRHTINESLRSRTEVFAAAEEQAGSPSALCSCHGAGGLCCRTPCSG